MTSPDAPTRPPPVSPRLVFRELSRAALPHFHALAVDAHVRRYLFDGQIVPLQWAAEAVASSERSFAEQGLGMWMLFDRSGGSAPIGFAGFWRFEDHGPDLQLLYALAEEHTGKGFAAEAAEALVGYAREHGALDSVAAAVDEPNLASIRVLEKLGFERYDDAPGAFGLTLMFRLPAGKPPARLHTERLVLRPWRDDDLPAFAAMCADPRVMEHFPAPLSAAQSDAIAARIRASFAVRGYGIWAIELPREVPFIGFVGLAEPGFEQHFTPCLELGWRLAAEYWGRGYATEAARAALRAAFVHLGRDEVVAFTVPNNLRSRRVMDKLGMHHDPADDFDHPQLPEGHPLRRHVLYRIRSP